jgi:hypothetical protein
MKTLALLITFIFLAIAFKNAIISLGNLNDILLENFKRISKVDQIGQKLNELKDCHFFQFKKQLQSFTNSESGYLCLKPLNISYDYRFAKPMKVLLEQKVLYFYIFHFLFPNYYLFNV